MQLLTHICVLKLFVFRLPIKNTTTGGGVGGRGGVKVFFLLFPLFFFVARVSPAVERSRRHKITE